jgi:hypothetical protein
MSLLSALKFRHSQVSLWADLTYVMIGQEEKIDLLKKPLVVNVVTIKQIARKIWTEPHMMSKATNGKTKEFTYHVVFAELLLSALEDPDFKQTINP